MTTKRAKKKPVKATEKTAPKTAPTLIRRPHVRGALLSGGVPGNKGGTGRPPDAWKALCRDLASSDAVIAEAKRVVEDPKHPAWLGAWKFLAEQGYGKPKESIEHSAHESLTELVTRAFGS